MGGHHSQLFHYSAVLAAISGARLSHQKVGKLVSDLGSYVALVLMHVALRGETNAAFEKREVPR